MLQILELCSWRKGRKTLLGVQNINIACTGKITDLVYWYLFGDEICLIWFLYISVTDAAKLLLVMK